MTEHDRWAKYFATTEHDIWAKRYFLTSQELIKIAQFYFNVMALYVIMERFFR